MMSLDAKQEYVREVSMRYRKASRKEKSRILDEMVSTFGYNRKYAVGLMNAPPPLRTSPVKRPRACVYSAQVKRALLVAWRASHELCGKRLAPGLAPLVDALERSGELSLSANIHDRLIRMSAATIDRLLRDEKRAPIRGRSLTKPGSLLRHQIPVRTFADWNESEHKPGFVEADLVAHCGDSAAGEFLHTLTLTDIYSGWTVTMALRNKGQAAVFEAVRQARALLPFALLGIDSDNGGEFINQHFARYCQKEEITFTRGRPYHKNDQCHVEQKNWCVVRQYAGYHRLEGSEAVKQLTRLYQALRLHVNFFQPSVKLLKKERIGARVKKTYDTAKTPYQRLLESGCLSPSKQKLLNELYHSLNPMELTRQIQSAQEELARLSKVRFIDEATKAA